MCMWLGSKMNLLTITLLFLLVNAAGSQEVDTPLGIVRGQRLNVLGKNVDVFNGVPFAEPPLGDLRFKHPVPVRPWRPAVKTATEIKPSCMQVENNAVQPLRQDPAAMDEDCLYLNMWVPADVTPGSKMAVMIFIFGGGFRVGSINERVYDGKYLAAENNVIVVTVNYRLGALGFMYLSNNTFPGNQGLMDQATGIKWVYDNVESFGGDRDKMTVFGESAGGAAVGLQLLAPSSRGYFTRAIMQSGPPTAPWVSKTREEARSSTLTFARFANCSNLSEMALYQCIRQLPAEVILSLQGQVPRNPLAFSPVIDGYFLPDEQSTLLEQGSIKKTDILIGFNKNEGTLLLRGTYPSIFTQEDQITVTRDQFITVLSGLSRGVSGSTDLVQPFLSQYEGSVVADMRDSYASLSDAIQADQSFRCPTTAMANQMSQWGDVYLYSFEHRLDNLPMPEWMGVPHSYDLEMVFGHPLGNVLNSSQEEQNLSRSMMTYWTNFAKTGNPNSPTSVPMQWPAFNSSSELFLTLDTGSRLRTEQGPRKDACVFWNDFVPLLSGNTQAVSTTERAVVMPCVSGAAQVKVTSMVSMVMAVHFYFSTK